MFRTLLHVSTTALLFCILCLAAGQDAVGAATLPNGGVTNTPVLLFEGPEAMNPLIERFQALDPSHLDDMMDLLGLDDAGGPIRVRLVTEASEEASLPPRWAVAYAIGNASLVVLIPSRVPGYPDKDLETVLYHEVAHVLVARAAGRRPVPRWFNEGVAMVAARDSGPGGWDLGDQGRLLWATIRRDGSQIAKLDRRFAEGPHGAARAYSLSAAFVRYLQDRFGPRTIARILEQQRQGRSFETAFRQATGASLYLVEEDFWQDLDMSHKWIPFLTSSATLWMIVTALALWAFRRRRQRDAELLAEWDERDSWQGIHWLPEAEAEAEESSDDRQGPWIH